MEENKKPSNPDLHKGQISLLQDRVTLRDHFAGLAMQAYISTYGNTASCANVLDGKDYISEMSYEIADSMLKQREL